MGDALSKRCRHCGLAAAGADGFCCFGCELANRLLADDEDASHRTAGALTLSLLLAMIVMMLSLFLYAEDVYEPTDSAMFAWLRHAYRWASALLATPVMLIIGAPLLSRALGNARRGKVEMELLVAIGALAAFVVSVVALLQRGSAIYFDSAVAALTIAGFGRYIEARARTHASKLVARRLEPNDTLTRAGHGAVLRRLRSAEIEPGMRLVVGAGDALPVDMAATEDGEVSLALLTGEPTPVAVASGDQVVAGAVVSGRDLAGVALRWARDSHLERIATMVDGIGRARTRAQRTADRMAGWLLPLVALVAAAALWWWSWSDGLGRGVDVALAVVLVACPCTYAVITPLISWLTLQKALGHGVCVRDAATLDAMARVRTVAFDKTGTLTLPLAAEADDRRYDALVAALEHDVRHPVARALRALTRDATPDVLAEREVVIGGVVGRDEHGRALMLGSAAMLAARGVAVDGGFDAYLVIDGVVVVRFTLAEQIQGEAARALSMLADAGIGRSVLSGDSEARVVRVVEALDVSSWAAALSPEAKLDAVRQRGDAALVGDGVNDAPAAAAALVSFAVEGATSLQRGSADVNLLVSDLRLVPWSLALARRATRLCWQALWGATLYNVVMVAIAALGLLRPVIAGLGMLAASLIALAATRIIARFPGLHDSDAALVEALA